MTLTYRDVAKDKITGQQGKGGPSTGSSLYDEQEHDHASPSLTTPPTGHVRLLVSSICTPRHRAGKFYKGEDASIMAILPGPRTATVYSRASKNISDQNETMDTAHLILTTLSGSASAHFVS